MDCRVKPGNDELRTTLASEASMTTCLIALSFAGLIGIARVRGIFVGAEIVTFSFAHTRAHRLSGSPGRPVADRSPSEWPALRPSTGIAQTHSRPSDFLPFP